MRSLIYWQVQLHVLVKTFITLMRKFVACVAKKDKHWIRIHAFSNLSLCKALIHFMISFGPSNLAQDWKWALRSHLEHNGVVMNSRKQMNVDKCWETSPWIPLSRDESLTKIGRLVYWSDFSKLFHRSWHDFRRPLEPDPIHAESALGASQNLRRIVTVRRCGRSH